MMRKVSWIFLLGGSRKTGGRIIDWSALGRRVRIRGYEKEKEEKEQEQKQK